MIDLYQRDRVLAHTTRRSHNSARRSLRLQKLLSLAAVHRVLTPQIVRTAFPYLYQYDRKAKRDLDHLAVSPRRALLRYKSQYKFYPDVYVITDKGYQECIAIEDVDNNIIPLQYQSPEGSQLLHELSISELAVQRYEYVRKTPDTEILAEGRFSLIGDLTKENYSKKRPANRLKIFDDLVPDYWYLKRDRNGMMFRCEEHIVGEASGTRIKNKLLEYVLWEQRPDVQEFITGLYRKFGAKQEISTIPPYEVHCIVKAKDFHRDDYDKERTAMMQTFYVPPAMQGKVWMGTQAALKESIAIGKGINGNVWHLGKHMLDKRARFGKKSGRARTRAIAEWMQQEETRPLFV